MSSRLASQPAALIRLPGHELTARRSSLAYVRGAVASPVYVSVTVFALCTAFGLFGILGALLAAGALGTLGVTAARSSTVRRHLDHHAESAARAARDATRLKLLRGVGPVRTQQYFELRDLVSGVEQADPREAARYDLQDLLEHFVKLARAQHGYLDALRIAGTHDLPQTIPFDDNRRKRRREIQARRVRHREECLAQVDRLADEIEAIDELIRLVAQRIACPAMPDLDRELDRRLWELDEVDQAMHQLTARTA
jgi:hypothetical protein